MSVSYFTERPVAGDEIYRTSVKAYNVVNKMLIRLIRNAKGEGYTVVVTREGQRSWYVFERPSASGAYKVLLLVKYLLRKGRLELALPHVATAFSFNSRSQDAVTRIVGRSNFAKIWQTDAAQMPDAIRQEERRRSR